MFENYRASKKDLEAIEEGIRAVRRPELDFIFKEKSLIKNVIVISYDSGFLYLWTTLGPPGLKTIPCEIKKYYAYKIPHKIKLRNEWQYAWCARIWDKKIEKLLPSPIQQATHFRIPRISGGLLTPFIELQKEKNYKFNAYTTYESYLATIVHEFGHVYWDQHKLWWYSDKKQNLTYLEAAKKLFGDKGANFSNFEIKIPLPQFWSEVFAFCSDYSAASLFWPKHKIDIDRMNLSVIKKAILKERPKDLERQNSLFDEEKSCHLTAAIFGKIILSRYPKDWPKKLLKYQTV